MSDVLSLIPGSKKSKTKMNQKMKTQVLTAQGNEKKVKLLLFGTLQFEALET